MGLGVINLILGFLGLTGWLAGWQAGATQETDSFAAPRTRFLARTTASRPVISITSKLQVCQTSEHSPLLRLVEIKNLRGAQTIVLG